MKTGEKVRVYMPNNKLKHGISIGFKEVLLHKGTQRERKITRRILTETEYINIGDTDKCLTHEFVEFQ